MQWAIEAAQTLQQRHQHPCRGRDLSGIGGSRQGLSDGAMKRSGVAWMASSVSPTVGRSHSPRGRWILTRLVMPHAFRHGSKPSYPRCGSRPTRTFRRVSPTPGRSPASACDDGRELSEQCRHYRGSIANPMSRDERLSKVRECARRSLQPADVERVIGMVETLETLPDLRQLMGILGHKSVP